MEDKFCRKICSRNDLKSEDFKYCYNQELTKDLDSIDDLFDMNTINKIVLWKVNRYPYLNSDIVDMLNAITKDKSYSEKHRLLVLELLGCRGINLPMASTLLRFRNCDLFQIIDQRVYRFITGKELKLPAIKSNAGKEKSANLYFDYLNQLSAMCKELELPFNKADRIFYNADKRINKDVKLRNYGSVSTKG